MKLQLTVNGVEDEIEILAPPPDCRFRLRDSAERRAQVATLEPGVYFVLTDGRGYEAYVEETHAGLVVSVAGYRFEIEAHDPRRWSRKSARRGAEGVQTLASPMPGRVVRVLTAPGDMVEAGQGIVVVEAMKMQNEMKAARAGKVRSVAATEGATVAAGEILATIE